MKWANSQKQNLPRLLNHEKLENLNKRGLRLGMKYLFTKNPGPDSFTDTGES